MTDNGREDVLLDAPGPETYVAEQAADLPAPPTIILQNVGEGGETSVSHADGVEVTYLAPGQEKPTTSCAHEGLVDAESGGGTPPQP